MRKLVSVVVALVCLVSLLGAACADGGSDWTCPSCGNQWPASYQYCPNDRTAQPAASGGWPVRSVDGLRTKLKGLGNDDSRHQSFYGPGSQYAQAGAYKPKKVTSLEVLFREGDYVYVKMNYQTAGKRCVYFKASSVADSNVDTVNLAGYPARTTTLLIPSCGPGMDYEQVTQRKASKYWDYTIEQIMDEFHSAWELYQALQDRKYLVHLEAGTRVTVFFETDGWVFAEFNCDAGLVRAWLPASYVAAN